MSKDSAHRFSERHWYRLSFLSILLLPIAACFALVVGVRRVLYRCGLLKSVRLAVPVIVAGNLTVGGTGKTPLVLWIAGQLRAAGRRPGIVLRGYGGSDGRGGQCDAPQAVFTGDQARNVGDEALLLAERSACPVWTGRDRAAAAQALLAAHPQCDVIVCDDGLQHYRLARDVEIAVEDERGHGNGLPLPAGPMREPAGRRVDAIVVNGNAKGVRARSAPVFHMRLVPDGFQRIGGGALDAAQFAGKRLHAVAGIGNPQRFFATLEALGLAATPHAFPDHYDYTSTDLDFKACDAVLMTEKDGVKCRSFGRNDLYILRVVAEPEPAFADFLLKAIHGRATA